MKDAKSERLLDNGFRNYLNKGLIPRLPKSKFSMGFGSVTA